MTDKYKDKDHEKIKKAIEDQIKDSQKFIKTIRNEKTGTVVYLVGTSHVSADSIENVRKIVRIVQPDTIFLELSKDREALLTMPESHLQHNWTVRPRIRWLSNDIATFTHSVMATSYYYSSLMAPKNASIPGGEMRAAFQEGAKLGCRFVLGDRDQDSTWNRVINNLDVLTVLKLYIKNVGSYVELAMSTPEEILSFNVDTVQEIDDFDVDGPDVMGEYPLVKNLFVDERDRFMAASLRDAPGKTIVAVAGKAHIKGTYILCSPWIHSDSGNERVGTGNIHNDITILWQSVG
eukprot:gene15940-18949_t